jgi:flagellar hook-associated protein 1
MPIGSTANRGLEIGRRALQAQQVGLNVTGNNIANANTPGFSRRQVNLANAMSGTNGVGSGVDATAVVRQRSQFLDAQARVQQQVLGYWESMEQTLGNLEAIFNESAGAGASESGTVSSEESGTGLSGSLNRFWNTWQDLANQPESGSARAAVSQEADHLTATFHQADAQLKDARSQLDAEVQEIVDQVNQLADQLAQVNAQIPRARFGQGGAADLEDQRDQLLEGLSQLVDTTVSEGENGQVTVRLGDHDLVAGDRTVQLQVRRLAQDGLTANRVFFADDHTQATVREGRLRGVMAARDEVIPGLQGRLDEVAAGLVEEVNRLHRAGYGLDGSTGVNFFAPEKTTAGTIAVDQAILADPKRIAASGDGNEGDNTTALGISALRHQRILDDGNATVEGFYRELLGSVGARSKEAQTMAENHRLFATQIDNRRQSVQGVSLNDEAAQLVLFQRAYQAAARTVSVIDKLMEVTINM